MYGLWLFCLTRTTLFTELFTSLYDQSYRFPSRDQVLLRYIYLPVSEIVNVMPGVFIVVLQELHCLLQCFL